MLNYQKYAQERGEQIRSKQPRQQPPPMKGK